MKLTISTVRLQAMVNKAVKGSGNNKLLPITSLMGITLRNGVLTLLTTDATNYLYVTEKSVTGDDMAVVVDSNTFSKLISKLTCENVTLELKDNILEVTGNGTYKIELQLDEDGEPIVYPNPKDALTLTDETLEATISGSTVQSILATIKPALATTYENPCYTGYYMADEVVATDTYKIACMSADIFDEPKLVSSEVMDLVGLIDDDKIRVDITDDTIIFTGESCVVYGKLMEDIDEYAIVPIKQLVDTEYECDCTVKKSELLQALDRLSLFIGAYDKNAINMTFGVNEITLASKLASGVEVVPYMYIDDNESVELPSYECSIDIQMLMQEVKAVHSDEISIYYGKDNAIKIVDGEISIVIALLTD